MTRPGFSPVETRRTIAAAATVGACYLIALSVLPGHVFWMPDEGAKYFQLHSIGLSWDEGVTYRLPFAGQQLVPGHQFLPGFDVYPPPSTDQKGQLYLPFDTPVVFPLLAKPFYLLFGIPGLYVIPAASGLLAALLSGWMIRRFDPSLTPIAVLCVGIATPFWFYSVLFWEHTLAALLGLIAIALFLHAPWRLDHIAASALFVIGATTMRTEMAPLGLGLGAGWAVAWMLHARSVATGKFPRPNLFALIALLGGIGLAIAFLEQSLTLRHRLLLRVVPDRLEQALAGIAHLPQGLLEVFVHSDISVAAPVGDGWVAAVAVALFLGLASPLVASAQRAAALLTTATALMVLAAARLLAIEHAYRSIHGFFAAAPFLVAWPYVMRSAWRDLDIRILTLGAVILVWFAGTFAAISITYLHSGRLDVGMEWGQRYLLTAYPVMTVLTLLGLRDLIAAVPRGALRSALIATVALAVVCSAALEVRGLRMLHGTKTLMAGWDRALRDEGPVMTTVWWIAPGVADLFVHHESFFIWGDNLDQWVEKASQHGVTSFTLASTEPFSEERLEELGLRRTEGQSTRTIPGGLLLARVEIGDAS